MADDFTLAHVSDPHLPPVPLPGWGECNAKRCLGFLNWQRKRRWRHLAPVLERLIADLKKQAPDHIAVTGDLVNIGLPSEYKAAARWLRDLGPPQHVSVIPGNHDIYVPLDGEPGIERWHDYMADIPERNGSSTTAFPYVRRLGHVALVGLCSAVPTPPFNATGRLDDDQLARIGSILDRLATEGLVRVVLIHHPPLPGLARPRRALTNACRMAEVLRRHGAEIVLHGHNHQAMLSVAQGPAGDIPVVGAPSASMGVASRHEALARYNLLVFQRDRAAGIELVERGLERLDGPVVELSRRILAPRRAT